MKETTVPRWLYVLSIRNGHPLTEGDQDVQRWLWGNEAGIRIQKRTHAWEIFAWTTARSVTLRLAVEPTDVDMMAVANLAGLTGAVRKKPPAVRFKPGVAAVPSGKGRPNA